jgi:hypothetical protein
MMTSKVKEKSKISEWLVVQHLIRKLNQVLAKEEATDEIRWTAASPPVDVRVVVLLWSTPLWSTPFIRDLG